MSPPFKPSRGPQVQVVSPHINPNLHYLQKWITTFQMNPPYNACPSYCVTILHWHVIWLYMSIVHNYKYSCFALSLSASEEKHAKSESEKAVIFWDSLWLCQRAECYGSNATMCLSVQGTSQWRRARGSPHQPCPSIIMTPQAAVMGNPPLASCSEPEFGGEGGDRTHHSLKTHCFVYYN